MGTMDADVRLPHSIHTTPCYATVSMKTLQLKNAIIMFSLTCSCTSSRYVSQTHRSSTVTNAEQVAPA